MGTRKIEGIDEIDDVSRANRAQQWEIARKSAELSTDDLSDQAYNSNPVENKHAGRKYAVLSTHEQLVAQMSKIGEIEDKLLLLSSEMYKTNRNTKHLQIQEKQHYEDRTKMAHEDSQYTSSKLKKTTAVTEAFKAFLTIGPAFPTIIQVAAGMPAPAWQGGAAVADGINRLFNNSYDAEKRGHEFQLEQARTLSHNYKKSGDEEDQNAQQLQRSLEQVEHSRAQAVHDIIGTGTS